MNIHDQRSLEGGALPQERVREAVERQLMVQPMDVRFRGRRP